MQFLLWRVLCKVDPNVVLNFWFKGAFSLGFQHVVASPWQWHQWFEAFPTPNGQSLNIALNDIGLDLGLGQSSRLPISFLCSLLMSSYFCCVAHILTCVPYINL